MVTFTMQAPMDVAQRPFKVKIVRFDPAASTLVAETVPPEHPLRGWRYWKAYNPGPDTLIVESGALDRPAPGWYPHREVLNWLGFIFDGPILGQQMQLWKEYIVHVKTSLELPEHSPPRFPGVGLVDGRWGWMDKAYILDNLCGPLNSTPIDVCRR